MIRTISSASWTATEPVGRRLAFFAFLVLGSTATVASTIAGNGNIGAALAPVVILAAVGALWLLPLRVPLMGIAFLGLGIDATGEGPWDSPLAPIGSLFAHNLNKTVPIGALAFPLVAGALAYLLVIHVYRRLAQSTIDGVSDVARTTPMGAALGFSFLAVLAECAIGYSTGGDLQMAKIQVQFFVLALLMAYLLIGSLRGIADYRALGRVILAAALSKALLALWVYRTIMINPDPAFATTHGDSILFASAAVMLIARFIEQPFRRNGLLCAACLPLLVGAMIANNRRIVWVELAAALFMVYCIGRPTRLKRVLTRAAVPLALAYVLIGWNSNASLFAPIRSMRTVSNADIDPSTLYRDLENFNLLSTLRPNPILGRGFGHPFDTPVMLPDISFFKEYQYMPHNSVLGLWCFTGWLGFTGLFLAVVVGAFLAVRSYRCARLPEHRSAALVALSMVLIYLIQCWGDIGFSEKEAIYILGPALALSAHLAVATGAWDVHPGGLRT